MNSYQLNMRAPAKVNYILEIGQKRDDNYHEILTVFQTISLADMIYFKPSREISFSTNAEDLGPPEQNLVYKAAHLLKKKYNVTRGATIFLQKNIPTGAGLGGGSSDAAATLRGLARLWELKVTRDDLAKLALQLGSDVPFFLEGGLAVARGRGEKISPVSRQLRPNLSLVLIYPSFAISTAWAYKTWDEQGIPPAKIGIDNFMKALYKSDTAGLAISLHNDFESVVIKQYPKIAEIKDKLKKSGALGTLMSGSGSSVFGIYPSPNEADRAAASLEKTEQGIIYRVTTL